MAQTPPRIKGIMVEDFKDRREVFAFRCAKCERVPFPLATRSNGAFICEDCCGDQKLERNPHHEFFKLKQVPCLNKCGKWNGTLDHFVTSHNLECEFSQAFCLRHAVRVKDSDSFLEFNVKPTKYRAAFLAEHDQAFKEAHQHYFSVAGVGKQADENEENEERNRLMESHLQTETIYNPYVCKNGGSITVTFSDFKCGRQSPQTEEIQTKKRNALNLDGSSGPVEVVSNEHKECWIQFELGVAFRPYAYGIVRYSRHNKKKALRNWTFEGHSEEKEGWMVLKKHENEEIECEGAFQRWSIEEKYLTYKKFRLKTNQGIMKFNKFEIYGKIQNEFSAASTSTRTRE